MSQRELVAKAEELYPVANQYPASEHAQKVFTKLAKATGTQTLAIYLAGEGVKYRNDTDRELAFRQESNFYYLTGCDIPGSHLLAWSTPAQDAKHAQAAQLDITVALFIPELDELDVMWSGMPLTPEEVAEKLDVTSVRDMTAFHSSRDQLPADTIHVLPTYNLPGETPSRFSTTDEYLRMSCQEARLTKTAAEIDLIQRANDITSRAQEGVMKACGGGETRSEYEAEAVFAYYCARKGSKAMAYESIAASCSSAGTLHYIRNKASFPSSGPDGLLLLDAGCEVDNYGADVTRTFPIAEGGKFTPEARDIYNLVLEMQNAAFGRIRPGCHYDTLQKLMHEVAIAGLLRLGILQIPPKDEDVKRIEEWDDAREGRESLSAQQEILHSGVSTAFFPHGLGHSLGLDVHDSPLASRPQGASSDPLLKYLRFRRPLEEGNVVTVEPGIYFNPFLLKPFAESPYINQEVLKRYMSVGGVRLEDDILITPHGFHNFTSAKKSIEDVEALCQSPAPSLKLL